MRDSIYEVKDSVADNQAFSFLEENPYVKELAEIFKVNGMNEDAKGLAEVISCVSSMERDLGRALNQVTAMRQELSVMRDEQNHPIRTMLQKATDGLIARIKTAQQAIRSLKEKIIGVCKRTVEAVKDQGITAAYGIVGALNIKSDLESQRDRIHSNISYCEKQIDRIDKASAELHAAGRHVKNIGRLAVGKEPIPDIKPNGKLAKLIQTPFRNEVKYQKRCLTRVDKTLGRIDKLERAATLRAESARPSVNEDMKRIKGEIDKAKPEVPRPEKVKVADQAL